MDAQQYGDRFQDHLLSQYKLYVEMADRVSQRRDWANRFYGGVLSGLAAVLAVIIRGTVFDSVQAVVFLVAASVGAALCLVWFVNIRSYRQLNTGKFQVIHEMEQQLPMAIYEREWELLRPSEGQKRYLQLTWVEQFVPGIIATPFLILTGYTLYQWIYG